ncbi:PREDICTED: protein FAR-RED-ELONGATED HYPOCOTYL 1-LIKE-like isoform X2 [Camelina sativa]|nr:PREDICTED: protein FAR-RED-ELONGATED HYPOCOTYL 1-LIKE-like isoform X2 [Camelina sativa]XP_010423889.1 PREDICTED: protein FAR-RED-ELONGATED HYPOCOTYL 1-LIKE-like isoform X2 [Camelina sativa]
MIVAVESLDSSKKRKVRAEESDLLPLPKHFCLDQQQASRLDSSCQSSDIEYAECSYATEDTKTNSEEASSSASFTGPSLYMFKDSVCSTGSSSSGYATSSIEQSCCSKVDHKAQEDADEDFTLMEFICADSNLAVEDDLQEVLNPVGSYILSSARWSVGNQDSEEATAKPTIDQEFEQYFSTLMM